jgi:hypothetical protein
MLRQNGVWIGKRKYKDYTQAQTIAKKLVKEVSTVPFGHKIGNMEITQAYRRLRGDMSLL